MPAKSAVKQDLGAFLPWVSEYRIHLRPGAEVIQGTLREGVDPTDPELHAVLTSGGRTAHISSTRESTEILLVRSEAPSRGWVHLGLLLATSFTVLAAGALLSGVDPLGTELFHILGLAIPVPTELDLGQLAQGWTFALPLMLILGAHEGGHMIAARRHGVPSSLPWFIPMPPYLSIIGTLGAFIRLRGPIVRRNALLDIGAWGPFAGFILALPLAIIGIGLSTTGFGPVEAATPYVIRFAGQPVWLGESALMSGLVALAGPMEMSGPLVLHPLAAAGWLGLFLTGLNLLPVGQLDGGHILYALHASLQRRTGLVTLAALGLLGLLWWGWWVWGVAIWAVSGRRAAHPSLFLQRVPLTPGRHALGYVAILLFFLTFVPVPMAL